MHSSDLLRTSSKDEASKGAGLFMTKQQMGDFLQGLRSNRPNKLTGARPPPTSFASKRKSTSNLGAPMDAGVESQRPMSIDFGAFNLPTASSAQSVRRQSYITPTPKPNTGRPLVRDPSDAREKDMVMELGEIDEMDPLSIPYLERSQRWMERNEAHSLRKALEDMDLKEEQKLYAAAQKEASELVWNHRNPDAPMKSADAPYDYREHLRKESNSARSASWTRAAQELESRKVRRRNSSTSRSISGGSKTSSAPTSRVPSDSSLKVPDGPASPTDEAHTEADQRKASDGSDKAGKRSVHFADPKVVRLACAKQNEQGGGLSSEKAPPPIKKCDVPDEIKVSSIAIAARIASNTIPGHFRNPFSRVRNAKASLSRASTEPILVSKKFDRIEIQRNPPTQSRDPGYTNNISMSTSCKADIVCRVDGHEGVKIKDGKEVRSEEIRKATSMNLKDRSPKLPTPTMVSDKPGRPIVSFDKNWKPKEIELKLEQSPIRALPLDISRSGTTKPLPLFGKSTHGLPTTVTPDCGSGSSRIPLLAPTITISDPSLIPSIKIGGGPLPSISIHDAPAMSTGAPTIFVQPPSISINTPSITISGAAQPASNRPLPTPSKSSSTRPSPQHAATAPAAIYHAHRAPNQAWSSIQCANCALPISGRIVSAAGVRFHPECFRCHHCGEGLECVAFYPEPDAHRAERLDRINAHLHGELIDERSNGTGPGDGDSTLRFYCHLDFHEFFSPRCKSCKTPIEGEIVVACGAEWHVGHFFCAQCGDPFDAKTPFVEKDGYAWCINCHTNRFSTKCRKCKKPVTDTVVKALGAEWHEHCFRCVGCSGTFSDGRYFLRPGEPEEPFCPACEERRLKA